MLVEECKLEKVAICKEGDSIIEVAKKIKKSGQRSALVLQKQLPVGIISAVDIVNKIVALVKDTKKVKAKEIMNKVKYLDSKEDLVRAYFAMAKNNFLSCPVVTDGKTYIGNLSLHEAIRNISLQNARQP